MEYYSVIENNAIYRNTGGPRECHTEWSESDREGRILRDIPGMWNLKGEMRQNELAKQKQAHGLQGLSFRLPEGRRGNGAGGESGMDMHTWLSLRWGPSEDLLQGTGNSASRHVPAWWGGESEGEWVHVYAGLSPFADHWKLVWHCLLIGYTPMKIKSLKWETRK